jgi:FAD/FMN-containing dehydrogenase
MPYTVLQSWFDALLPYGVLRCYWKSLHLDNLGDGVTAAIVKRAAGKPAPEAMMALWRFGGAMNRGAAETAFGGQSAAFLLSLDTSWTNPADDAANIAWTRRVWSEMHAYSSGGLYLNFGGFGEKQDDLVCAGFDPAYHKLVEVRNTYDPTNLFQMNQNIRPTS